MKKLFKLLFTFIGCFGFCICANAATVNFGVSTSSAQVIVGKNVTVSVTISSSTALGSYEYTLNYDKSIFKCIDSGMGLNYAGVVQNNNTKSVTFKYVFTALKSGTGKFYIDSSNAFDFNENVMSPSNGSKSVKVITAAEYQASLSKNNNLGKLEVEGYEIDPKFDKDTLEYTVNINEEDTSINIIATPEDKKASIAGGGKQEVTAGSNTFDIVVVAENGSEKTYKLTALVVDKDPIEVKYDGKTYTVVKIKSNLTEPTGYTETTVNIENYEIPAFYSEITDFTLVGLKDEEGNCHLFIYVDGKYTKYTELKFGSLTIYPLQMTKELDSYSKSSVTIQGEKIECLETSKKSRFKIIYGINVETNEKTLFVYDTVDGVAVAYDNEIIDMLNKKISIITYVAIGLALATFICLVLLVSKKNTNKVPKEKKKKKEVQPNDTYIEKDELEKEEKNDSLEEEFYDIFEAPDKKKNKKKKH